MGDATTILTYAQNKQDMICNNALGTAIIKRFHPQLCMCTGMGMGAENQCSNYVSSFCWTLLGLEMIFLKQMNFMLAVFGKCVCSPDFLRKLHACKLAHTPAQHWPWQIVF